MAFIGDTCRVVAVQLGSDAAGQGLAPGDVVHRVEGIAPTRGTLFQIQYVLATLAPRGLLHARIGHDTLPPREMRLAASVVERRRLLDLTPGHDDIRALIRTSQNAADSVRSQYAAFGDTALVWRYRAFEEAGDAEDGLKRARGHGTLVLDLRNNSGGTEAALLRLLIGLYREPTPIATPLGRKGDKSLSIQGGDARGYFDQSGTETVALYGTLVATEDFPFPDGSSVESSGVYPDEVMLPSGADLRDNRDPVLARALALAGVEVSPAEPGRIAWTR